MESLGYLSAEVPMRFVALSGNETSDVVTQLSTRYRLIVAD
jgi:hypothetical protein